MAILLEFKNIGIYTKLTAIDEKTGEEACIIVPKYCSRKYAEKIAIKKLNRKLSLRQGKNTP